MFWFVKLAHCQFTQLYFGTPGCQLEENLAYSISCVGVFNLATCMCMKTEEEGPGENPLQYFSSFTDLATFPPKKRLATNFSESL